MINSIKKLFHIALKRKTWPRKISAFGANHPLHFQNAFMNTLANATRKRSWDKCFIKYWVQYSKNSVVQNAIASRCFVNMSNLRISNIKTSIGLMFILLRRQITVKLEKVLFELELKRLNILLVTLINPKFIPRRKEIF